MEEAATQMKYEISIEKTAQSRIAEVDFDNIPFGRVFSDHMYSVDYEDGEWKNPKIMPFGQVAYNPAMSSLHYGQLIFEGMKAYKDHNGDITLFRHLKNFKRFNVSAHRMAMPQVPREIFEGGLMELLKLDQEWIPDKPGSSLYIRPFMFATDEYIGIRPSLNYRFIIFTCPVGPYYDRPVKVKVAEKYVRAFKGGTGYAKTAGNYAATLRPVMEAKEEGFDQILWLDGCNFEQVHEIGTMNVFFVIDGRVVTPSIETGEILEGITRDSVIEICKAKGIPVETRIIHIQEIINAYHNNKLEEAFGAGTAATIAQIAELGYKGEHMILPPVEERKISNLVREELVGIKRGIVQDNFGWTTRI